MDLRKAAAPGHRMSRVWPGAAAFLKSIDASKVLDYRLYVRHAISLSDIDFALVTSSYSSWEEYIEAVGRVAENARAYNLAERAMFREPRLVGAAEQVLLRAKQELCLAVADLEGLRKGAADPALRALRSEVMQSDAANLTPGDSGAKVPPEAGRERQQKPTAETTSLPKLVVKAPKLTVRAPQAPAGPAGNAGANSENPAPEQAAPTPPPAAKTAIPRLVVRMPGAPPPK